MGVAAVIGAAAAGGASALGATALVAAGAGAVAAATTAQYKQGQEGQKIQKAGLEQQKVVQQQQVEMANRQWLWQQQLSKLPDDDLRLVQISVSLAETPDQVLYRLQSYKGKPGG